MVVFRAGIFVRVKSYAYFALLIFSEIGECRISCLSIDEPPFSVFLEEFGRKNL